MLYLTVLKPVLDFLAVIIAFWVAREIRIYSDFIPYLSLPQHEINLLYTLKFALLAAILLIVVFALQKKYFHKKKPLNKEIIALFSSSLIWWSFIVTVLFFARDFFYNIPLPRLMLLFAYLITICFLVVNRFVLNYLFKLRYKKGKSKVKILLIGHNKIANQIYHTLSKDIKYEVIGCLDDERKSVKKGDVKIIADIKHLEDIVKKYQVNQIIQTDQSLRKKSKVEILDFCLSNLIAYKFVPDILELHSTNILNEELAGYPLISLNPTSLDGWGRIYKRIFDIVVSFIVIVFLFPWLLLIAFLIKLDSKGPILFSKKDNGTAVQRVGQKGKLFNYFKFRSMKDKTDNLRYTSLADKNIRTDGPLVKIKDDPRITRVGKFIRRYSLDELPEFFLVLRGKMSLVGPRPHLPEEVSKYKDHQRRVLAIKPGITGMAQVSGRSDLSFDEEVRLDLSYIQNWSLWQDLLIIFKTVGVVLLGSYEE